MLFLMVFAFFAGTAIHGCGGGDDKDSAEQASSTPPKPIPCLAAGENDQQVRAAYGSAGSGASEFNSSELRASFYEIFRTGNRNAASFKWFNFIKSQKENPELTFDFEHLNKFYCPISGSPTYGNHLAKMTLPRVGSLEPQEGAFSYCCTPCFCDLLDFAYVDTVTVAGACYNAIVMGNPCANEELLDDDGKLDVAFEDPFRPGQIANLAEMAPEVACECSNSRCRLRNATLSDGGYPVIGLFFDASEGEDWENRPPSLDRTRTGIAFDCQGREEQGYSSGMGMVFRKVAEINPIQSS